MGTQALLAQNNASFVLCIEDSTLQNEKRCLTFGADSLRQAELTKELSRWQLKGYLDARADTVRQNDTLLAILQAGVIYRMGKAQIRADSTMQLLLASLVEPRGRKNIDDPQSTFYLQSIITTFENRGYPFVQVKLDSIFASPFKNEYTLETVWNIDAGPRFTFDSLIFKADAALPMAYLKNYIHYKKGSVYNEGYLQSLRTTLSEIAFVQLTGNPQVIFSENNADLILTLKRRKANFFNGVLGFQPVEGGGLTITGDAEIKLISALNRGEEFFFNWRRIKDNTQDLKTRFAYPFLFNTPLGIEGDLNIYRRDTTFSSFRTALGTFLSLGGTDRLKLTWERQRSSALAQPAIGSTLRNIETTFYNLNYTKERLDYRLNPRKGYALYLEAGVGNRTSRAPSREINTTVDRSSAQRFQFTSEYYIPLFKRQTIRMGLQGAWYNAPAIAENELFRIGGIRSLRGLDEESIFASAWGVFSLEYRFILERNSSLFVFGDQSWFERNSPNAYTTDTPLGFGTGINFETASGIFTFTYALAQQFDNPILLRNARLSFGFKNLF